MPFLELIRPKLTTVRIQQHSAGRTAATILLQLMDGEKAEDVPTKTILPVEIIVRESTAQAR
jgi:LacI family transcriptional regulator